MADPGEGGQDKQSPCTISVRDVDVFAEIEGINHLKHFSQLVNLGLS